MDMERQKARVANLLKEIDLLSRHDNRNACIKTLMEKKLHSAKLIEAGKLFEEVGILDTYDSAAVLHLLEKEKEKIVKKVEA